MIYGSSLFSQLLHHFPRTEFAQLVAKHQAEHRSKGFSCWTQLVAMLFCHMAHADSLREICGGLACCIGKLRHLGISKAPNKSTLSYANQNRPAALYEISSGRCCSDSETKAVSASVNASFVSRTSCSVLIQQPFHFV